MAPLDNGSRWEELSVDGGSSCGDEQAGAEFGREELFVNPHGGEHGRNDSSVMQVAVAGSGPTWSEA